MQSVARPFETENPPPGRLRPPVLLRIVAHVPSTTPWGLEKLQRPREDAGIGLVDPDLAGNDNVFE